jgi:hypothetical protein
MVLGWFLSRYVCNGKTVTMRKGAAHHQQDRNAL